MSDEETGEVGTLLTAEHIKKLASDPSVLEALKAGISGMAGVSYPPAIKRRIKALKCLQLENVKLEAEFYKEVQELEAKYQALQQPIFDKRSSIVTGAHEPTEEECTWEEEEGEEEEEEEEEGEKSEDKKESAEGTNGAKDKDIIGIPAFWLHALKNVDLFDDFIEECDEPILEHLTDIKVVYASKEGMDFSLEFHFKPNEYFSDAVLVKSYKVACVVSEDDPFSFEGATITSCEGCKINWSKGKNVTIRTVKKTQKHKGKGQSRTVTKTVPNKSFFSFFSPPKAPANPTEGDEEDEETMDVLSSDFARAEHLRDRLVPRAVLFFTGEALEDDDFEGEEGEEEEEEDAEDDDYDPQRDLQNKKPECKQQ